MAATHAEATDDVLARLKTAWDAGAAAAIGVMETPELVYEWTDKTEHGLETRSDLEAWARASVRHGDQRPRSLGGAPGHRMMVERQGFLWVEIRTAFTDGKAGPKGLALAQVVMAAYEKKRDGTLWYPRAELREMGKDGRWFRHDVLAYFRWTTQV